MSSRPRLAPLALLVLVVLAALPRVWVLHSDSLDADEVFSRRVALLPVGEAIERIRHDAVHPPVYYAVLGATIRVVGDGQDAIRLPSLIAGLVLVALSCVVAGRVLQSTPAGILGGVLVAASTPQVYYSAHARNYALYALLVLLLFWALVRALEEPSDRSRWVVFGATCVAATWTHYVAWLYVGVTLPMVLTTRSRPTFVAWLASVVATGGLFLFWTALVVPYLVAKGGLGPNLGWVETPHLYSLLSIFATFNGLPPVSRGTSLTLLVGLLVLASSGHLLWKNRRTPSPRSWWLALLLLGATVPPLLLFVLAEPPLSLPFWGYRHLHPSQACWAVAAAVGAAHCFGKSGVPRAALVAGLLALVVTTSALRLRYPLHQPFADLAAQISKGELVSLPVFATGTNIEWPVDFYLDKGRDVELLTKDLDPAVLPLRFLLLHRRAVPVEREIVAAITRSVEKRQGRLTELDSIRTGPDDAFGTTVTLVEVAGAVDRS